jgi:hypothetical protein
MRIVPTGFSSVTETQAQQKAFQAITRPALVMDGGRAGANQVTNGFVLLVRDMDGREFPGSIKTGKLIGIPPVRLHPIGSLFGNERRTDQVAANAFAAQMAAKNEAARPGFINQAQFDVWLRETFEEFINGVECSPIMP